MSNTKKRILTIYIYVHQQKQASRAASVDKKTYKTGSYTYDSAIGLHCLILLHSKGSLQMKNNSLWKGQFTIKMAAWKINNPQAMNCFYFESGLKSSLNVSDFFT
jgi:hypothetical protein